MITLVRRICKSKWIGLVVILSLASSCSPKLEKENYFNYYNGFADGSFKEFKANGLTYQLQYRPKEYLALNEMKGEGDFSRDRFKEVSEQFSDQHQFCLRIIGDGKKDVLRQNLTSDAEYYTRLEKINTQFPLMVRAITKTDTLHPSFHHFERAFQLRPFIQILFALDYNPSLRKLEQIQFLDEIFQNQTPVIFDDMEAHIKDQPTLSF